MIWDKETGSFYLLLGDNLPHVEDRGFFEGQGLTFRTFLGYLISCPIRISEHE